jgi:hypothetical protein
MNNWSRNIKLILPMLILLIIITGIYSAFFREVNVDIKPNDIWIENDGNPFEDMIDQYTVLEVKDGWVKYYKKYPPLMLQDKLTGDTFLIKSKPISKFVHNKKKISK